MRRLLPMGIVLALCGALQCGSFAYADEVEHSTVVKSEVQSEVIAEVNEPESPQESLPSGVKDNEVAQDETVAVSPGSSDANPPVGDETESNESVSTPSDISSDVSTDEPQEPVSDYEKVEDGAYTIESALGTSLDVSGASQDDAANVQTYYKNYTIAQRYQIAATGQETTGEWFYTITNVNSGKVLDCAWGGTSSGTNVQQYSSNGTGAQRWFLRKETYNGTTTYQVINAASGLALDVYGANAHGGANVQIYNPNGTSAQKWLFLKCAALVGDGAYEIKSGLAGSYVVDVANGSSDTSASLQIFGSNSTLAQSFALAYDATTGYYVMTNYGSGMVADVQGGSLDQGTRLQQYTPNGTKAQKWQLIKHSDGSFTFVSAASGLAMDVRGGVSRNGTVLQQYAINNTAAQRFFLKSVTPVFSGGTVTIRNGANGNTVIDVPGASTEEGSSLQLFSPNGTFAQKFKVVAQDDGSYSVTTLVSGLQMSVSGTGAISLEQDGSSGFSQRWKIVPTNDGHFALVSAGSDFVLGVSGNPQRGSVISALMAKTGLAYSWNIFNVPLLNNGYYSFALDSKDGLVLDVSSASLASGANVHIWQNNGSNAQKFYIKSVGNEVYSIQNAWSTLYMDVANGSKAAGANVWQYSGNGTNAQRWQARWDGCGGFVFSSSLGDFALGVLGDITRSGNNACLVDLDESGANQRFILTSTTMAALSMNDRIVILDSIGGDGLNIFKSINNPSQQTISDLYGAIASYENRGISVGFLMMDLGTGDGISYGIDHKYASASSIKGPYVAAVNKYAPWVLDGWSDVMLDIIRYSSNESYAALRNAIGADPLAQLINDTHAWGFDWSPYYVEYAPRDLTKLWVGMADYFLSDQENAWWCREMYGSNLAITSRPTLSWKGCPIYAKSGWIDYSEGEYTTVHNEGCIVMEDGHPYLMVIMSEQTHYDSWYMSNLMTVLDRAHTEMKR